MNTTRRARIKAKTPAEFERWRRLAEKIKKNITHTTSNTTSTVNDEC